MADSVFLGEVLRVQHDADMVEQRLLDAGMLQHFAKDDGSIERIAEPCFVVRVGDEA